MILLWPISTLGLAFEQEGKGGKKGWVGGAEAEMNWSYGMDG